ncbi:MAG: hypothetical protein DRQ49_00165 [Gammaproteobacteria bacterium]|nr:MAG: hypothetical protein DRQ41_06545 [Gammaproteobacteria bacterium]RKZ43004.1 MAG: hypothetical protein DRQ49_00165 [Gammaproteobacteria bacterium]RKZ77110.1 MAG: hypothetical protein DRQ57_01275 [Gammaproteobacteria bacterium]
MIRLKNLLAMPVVENTLYFIGGILFIGLIVFSLLLEPFLALVKKIYGVMGPILRILFVGMIALILGIYFIFFLIRKIPRMINWLFVIGFIAIGIVLYTTFFEISLVFIITGILISPYTGELLQNKLGINFASNMKVIVALLALVTVIVLFKEETEDKRFFVGFLIQTAQIDYDNDNELNQLSSYLYGVELKKRKETYLSQREELLAYLQFWSENDNYLKVISQGSAYITFDSQIRHWVEEANTVLNKQKIKNALEQVPELMKAKKYREAYHLAAPLKEIPELQKQAIKAKKIIDKEIAKLRSLYEKGRYKKVILKGTPYVESDCQVRRLVNNAQLAKAKLAEHRRFNKEIQKINQTIKARKYEQAIDLAKKSEYALHPKILKLIDKAKLKRKQAEEKKILARLRILSPTHIETHIREYSHLIKLFPENQKYQRKLMFYKKKLIDLRRQPALLITRDKYGDKWPFIVNQGYLECLPPGIVTFRLNDKIYAVNGLASSRGYLDIDEIWREDPIHEKLPHDSEMITKVDMGLIIHEGLKLCNPKK